MATDFDDIVIGSGMAGLTVGALLARSGRRVLLLEAHDTAGGYAHTFTVRNYRFCAQVHYIFNCGEGESIHAFLDKIGVVKDVPFVRLDVEGFDHVVVDRERFRIPTGLAKFEGRLLRRFPEAAAPLREYFRLVGLCGVELDQLDGLPDKITAPLLLKSAWKYRHLLRFLKWTLDDVYDHVKMPQRLRAILAGQCGDYLLPPRDVSFLLHVALVYNYDKGAYYPEGHFFHMVDTIVDVIRKQPGCMLLLEHEVDRIEVEGGRVTSVRTTNGKHFTARRFVSNVDPRRTAELAGDENFSSADKKYLAYDYSCGTYTMYLGIKGLDLREHGFGSYNVWRYPHDDINRIYDDQLLRHDISNPWLFLSTPTLHSGVPGLCPEGEQILEIATSCDHAHWSRLRRHDRRAYNAEKKKIRETILDVLEAEYVPKLRQHLSFRMAGTPATNERYCWAPAGNAYGANLTPANVGFRRRPWKASIDNLYMANATAGFPSVAGTVGAGIRLYQDLTGDRV